MLEIIILYKLCKRIGWAARKKEHRAIGYQLMLILFWFGGEIGTMLLYRVVRDTPTFEQQGQYLLFGYMAGVAGAVFGAWLTFRIVANLPVETKGSGV